MSLLHSTAADGALIRNHFPLTRSSNTVSRSTAGGTAGIPTAGVVTAVSLDSKGEVTSCRMRVRFPLPIYVMECA